MLSPLLAALAALAAAAAAADPQPLAFNMSGWTDLRSAQVQGFQIRDCAAASAAAHITSLRVHPDPIVIPGNVSIAGAFAVKKTMSKPLSLKLKLRKNMVGNLWLPIPCVDNIGSCTYDFCDLLTQFVKLEKNGTCPEFFRAQGIPCRCPITKFEAKIPQQVIRIPNVNLPSFISDGTFEVTIEIAGGQGNDAFCAVVQFDIKTKHK